MARLEHHVLALSAVLVASLSLLSFSPLLVPRLLRWCFIGRAGSPPSLSRWRLRPASPPQKTSDNKHFALPNKILAGADLVRAERELAKLGSFSATSCRRMGTSHKLQSSCSANGQIPYPVDDHVLLAMTRWGCWLCGNRPAERMTPRFQACGITIGADASTSHSGG